jgi:hypothetical protein
VSYETDRIEADINQSRHRLNDTIDALGSKLSPGQMVDEALGLLQGQAGQFAGNLGRQVRDNPMPAALIAAGVAWMILSKNQRHQEPKSHSLTAQDWAAERGFRSIEEARLRMAQHQDESAEAYFDRMHSDYAKSLDLKQKAGEAAHEFKQRVNDTVAGIERRAMAVRERMAQTFAGAAHLAHDQAERAGEAAADIKHKAESFYEENPLAAGALALAIGALIGSAAPLTEAERSALGDVADKAVDTGARLAEKGARKVQGDSEAMREQVH